MPVDYPDILAQNRFDDATVTYDATEDTVYKAEYVGNRGRTSKFVGEDTAIQNIMLDLGSALSVDTFVLDKNYSITGSPGSLILQYSDLTPPTIDTDGHWTTLLTLTTASGLTDNTVPSWNVFAAESHRYWRLHMTGIAAAPVIFNVWLGTRIQLDKGPLDGFDPWAEQSMDTPVSTRTGLTQIVHLYSKRKHSAQWRGLLDADMVHFELWWSQAVGSGLPWWFLWKPASLAGDPVVYQPICIVSPNAMRMFPFDASLRAGFTEGDEI